MMSNEYVDFVIRARVYKTKLTKKFENRKFWINPVAGVVKAVLPGVALEFKVSEGELVKEGQPLLIFEAMKTQNMILSPIEGTVKRIAVEAAQRVAKGEVMIEIQPH